MAGSTVVMPGFYVPGPRGWGRLAPLARARMVADDRPFAQHGAGEDASVGADAHARGHERSLHQAIGSELRPFPDHGVADARPRADGHAGGEDGAWPHLRAGGHAAAGPHVERAFELRALLDLRPRMDPAPGTRAALELDGKAAVQDVAMHLHVLLRRADVDPVPTMDPRPHEVAPAEEGGEEAALDGMVLAGGHQGQGRGVEDVDAGVDRVARDLGGIGRLLDEAPHPALAVGLLEA